MIAIGHKCVVLTCDGRNGCRVQYGVALAGYVIAARPCLTRDVKQNPGDQVNDG